MKLKVLALAAALCAAGAPALAESCSRTEMRGNALKLARDAYSQLMNPYLESTVTIDQLMDARQKERSCKGQGSLNYLIMIMQIQRGDLETSIQNMAMMLQTDAEPIDKHRMISTLIGRLVAANDIQAAIAFTRRAIEEFPDRADDHIGNLVLLLAGTRQFEEARQLADARLEATLDEAGSGRLPYAAWLRLAVSEVSGDAADREAVLARLEERTDGQAREIVEAEQSAYDFLSMLLIAFDPKARPRPMSPPKPGYPEAMAWSGREGQCDARFEVSPEGMPEHITVTCTHDGFVAETRRAVSEVRFQPAVIKGEARRVYNVVYPFEYRIH